MKRYKIIHKPKDINNILYFSFETAKSDIDMLVKVLWHLSIMHGVENELEKLSEWLKENNKNKTIKEICEFDMLNDKTIVEYIKDCIKKFSIDSNIYIRQIIEVNTSRLVYDTENMEYFGDFISGECDYYNALEQL